MRQIAKFDAVENILIRLSIISLAVKSVSGSAAIGGSTRASRNDSVVATSTSICEGRSARDQITPPSTPTSPDCTPWLITGRSAARLRYGIAMLPARPIPVAVAVVRKRRRDRRNVIDASLESFKGGVLYAEAL